MSTLTGKRSVKRRYAIVAVILAITLVGVVGYQIYTASTGANNQSALVSSAESSALNGPSTPSQIANGTISPATNTTQPVVPVTLSGAGIGVGASLPASLFKAWSTEFLNVSPAVTVKYSSSTSKISRLVQGAIDFGASDVPLSNTQLAGASGLVLFPETLGGVAITYNLLLLGLPKGTILNFTPDVLVGIYFGQITQWNDPRIAAINPGIVLPGNLIAPVHRSDAGGTTYTFTSYLSSVSPNWATEIGYGTSVKWPADILAYGVGAKGNAGVEKIVSTTAGAIGYVDVNYANANNLTVGSIKNAAGNYVAPTMKTIEWAAANSTIVAGQPGVLLNAVNAQGQDSYPIVTATYIVLYKDMSQNAGITIYKARALANFLSWVIHDGQQYAPGLFYAPLPQNIVSADEQLISILNYQGHPLLNQS
ncbi:MAG TPA: phosphate ABC transporter substrate-binding protein PstS [Candidatus Acidoferrum sp.]|nr:phosphate ABC transporter substrate-binding protein PstS [Candidatus Acidoferrum sp.]